MMPRSLALVLALATLSVGAHAHATNAAGPGTSSDSDSPQQQAAPIVRSYGDPNSNPQANAPMQPARTITSSHPIPGVTLRVDANTSAQTVSADAKGTELRIAHGVANVSVRHPEKNARILVDLPGGQTALLKDGLYTFNADTNIVRVLKGEADAYPGAAEKGIKLKEDHQFEFSFAAAANGNRSTASSQQELMADYLPGNPRNGDGYAGGYGPGAGYGPYGDGYYGYPYAYGYPYGWGYPYGFGFGYYGGFGGFRGGGFRGRFR